jgi:hypothetical protein
MFQARAVQSITLALPRALPENRAMPTGWKLEPSARAALLERHPPTYPRVVADHVTFKSDDGARDAAIPDPAPSAEIVGRADDGEGVEAYVVAIDGDTGRPDGGTWHITWSLGQGREAKESNDVLAGGWEAISPEPVALVPARW